jgi:short-subunit dehydrogenase
MMERAIYLVIGCNGGLGKALCDNLEELQIDYYGTDVNVIEDVSNAKLFRLPEIKYNSNLDDAFFENIFRNVEIENKKLYVFNVIGLMLNEQNHNNLDKIQSIYQLNLIFPILLTNYILKFENIDCVHILSSAQWFPVKKFFTYSDSKFLLYTHLKRIKNSHKGKNRIKYFVPSGFASDMHSKNNLNYSKLPRMKPDKVAKLIIKHKNSNSLLNFIGFRSYLMYGTYLILPTFMATKFVNFLTRKVL